MQTHSIVRTESAATYMRKLCRHFAHKVPATLSRDQGVIEFPFGRCRLEAAADVLRIVIDVADPAQLDSAERVVGDHLKRMAPREELDVAWLRDAATAQGLAEPPCSLKSARS